MRPLHTQVAANPVADPFAGLGPRERPRVRWRTAAVALELVHQSRSEHAADGGSRISWWLLVDENGALAAEWHTRRKCLRWLALHHPDGRWEAIDA